VEELERREVLHQLLRRFGDGQEQRPLTALRSSHEEFETEGGLPGPNAPRDQDHVAPRNPPLEDAVEPFDSRGAPFEDRRGREKPVRRRSRPCGLGRNVHRRNEPFRP
jgi:hypothetical protein